MIFDVFYTSKFDNDIFLIDGEKSYSYFDVKKRIASLIEVLKNKKENIVILEDNNFNFIIQFFACVFSNKKIYLVADKNKIKEIEVDFDIVEVDNSEIKDFNFPKINPKEIVINFLTSGTVDKSKVISKTLFNLIQEGIDLGEEFNLKNCVVSSTTTMCHLFGLTHHLMMSFCNGLKINVHNILYPNEVDLENNILISTPSFLNSILKYEMEFKINPSYIFSAGSKLNDEIFKNLEKNSKIVEIYGSTESGVIAYKTHYNSNFKIFKNVEIEAKDDYCIIKSNYAFNNFAKINDRVEIEDNNLRIISRSDRVVKIYDKRVALDELEKKLKNNVLIEDCYLLKSGEKLSCLACLSLKGREFLFRNGIVELNKNLKHYLLKYSQIIPQRFKYFDVIPTNKTGKIDKKFINHLFDLKVSTPVILGRNVKENEVIFQIYFYNQANFFKGHFPQFKLVAGVEQLFLALELLNHYFNLELIQGQHKRIKFSNPIIPDKIINLRLIKDEKSVQFEYFDNKQKYSSGSFMLENLFREYKI